jgi:predicted O-methyltransferase YrrM
MLSTKAQSIFGWMPDRELEFLAQQAAVHTNIVEIGSFMGRSTRTLAEATRGTVTAVDTWAGSDEDEHRRILEGKPADWLFDEFKNNMAGLTNVAMIRMTSLDAAANFCTQNALFDFIFIDASHDHENVKADILAWGPLVAPGGTLAGHDFHNGAPGVIKAVDELLQGYKLFESIWYVTA